MGRFLCDRDYRIVAIDPQLASEFGCRAGDVIGAKAIDLVLPVLRPRVLAALEALVHGDKPAVVVPSVLKVHGGVELDVTLSISPMVGDAPAARAGWVITVLGQPRSPRAGDAGQERQPPRHAEPLRKADAHAQQVPPRHRVTAAHSAERQLSAAKIERLLESVTATAGAVTSLLTQVQSTFGTVLADGRAELDGGASASGLDLRQREGRRLGSSAGVELEPDGGWALASERRGRGVEPLPDRTAAPVAPVVPQDVDSLTGLATRAALVRELESISTGADVAVLLVDLDEFKQVNDLHGHDVGDEVLVHVAQQLRLCVRPSDLVVRFGGDEFVILCRNSGAALTVAARIGDLLSAPVGTSVGAVTVTSSVGISDGSIPYEHASELLTRADAAMYWAKRAGKDRFFRYDDDLHERTLEEKSIEHLLRRAFAERRIQVDYQPIVDASGVTVVGVEAMARLIGDKGEVRMPAEFLPVAERTGLIGAIDAWVLTESCRCIAGVARTLDIPLAVSVNVSAQFIARTDLIEIVTSALRAARIPASMLMIEIGEPVLSRVGAAALDQLGRLRALGVRVALDNFGAGDAPLSVLRTMPLSHIKVDRPCLTRGMADHRDAAMIEAVTWLVEQLGLVWIAEGVETDAQWQAAQRYGPGMAQGYLFAEPLSEAELRRTLSSAADLGIVPGTIAARDRSQ